MTTSASPSRISRAASPTALPPAAHAVTTEKLGPVKPRWRAMNAAVALDIIIGTRNGLTRMAPRWEYLAICSSSVMRPPTPVPDTTPILAGSASRSPAWAKASTAAANPSWVTRSRWAASLALT